MVIVNARILTFDEAVPSAEAVAIRCGRIVFVGSNNDVNRFIGDSTVVVDANGRIALPGLIDAHLHLASLGFSLVWLNLRGVKSIEELKQKVFEAASKVPEGTWIIGRGWDQELFSEKRYPNRWDLDEVAPRHPVLLTRGCGHIIVVNSLALKLAGISRDTKDPVDGIIDRDERGEPTGILREGALGLVWRAVPEPSIEDYEKAIERAIDEALRFGLTTVHAVSVTANEFSALQRLWLTGRLKIRVRVYLSYDLLESLKGSGILGQYGDDFLRICGIKLLVDGSLGGRTAALREPYSDKPDVKGKLLMHEDKLSEIIREAFQLNLQVAVHAIGDKAIEVVLNALEKANIDSRFVRIEHVSLTPPDLLNKLEKLKPIVTVQPHFIITDWWVIDRLGEDRGRYVYAFKSLQRLSLIIAGSSDAPVEPVNPWSGIYAAVTRGEFEGLRISFVSPDEKMNLMDALRMYTVGGASASLEGNKLGRIKEGYYADIIILDTTKFPPDNELEKINVWMSIVGGKVVYRKH